HVLIFKDVTEDRKLRRKLHFEGLQDALTGLLNRRAFEHRFDAMINEAEVTRSQHIMVYINLDQFKLVNDNSGSEAGDELLKKVAKTIQDRVRKSDSLARLGSDEFGILFPYARTDAAEKTVNEILRLIVQHGFNWQDREFHITASASLIEFGHSNDRFADMYEQLMDACLQAKQNGGNQCVPVYS
nr:diguanylate cyclase [Gammaproteobacteria bacterium]